MLTAEYTYSAYYLLCKDTEEGHLVVEEELLSLHLDGGTAVLGEEDGVVDLHGGGPVLVRGSHSHHRTLVDLTGHLLGDQDTSLGLLRRLGALHQHTVTEGLKLLEGGGRKAEHCSGL
ncbi:chaperonin GroES [Angomonas deanei]|nr:chaperonin GroES [Angomonas deanei]|eukprot:EPY37753.1 chaperonin GroES [Angomonas deanei]